MTTNNLPPKEEELYEPPTPARPENAPPLPSSRAKEYAVQINIDWAKQICYDLTGMAPETTVEILVEVKNKSEKLNELIEMLKDRDNADDVDQWILEVREMYDAWARE